MNQRSLDNYLSRLLFSPPIPMMHQRLLYYVALLGCVSFALLRLLQISIGSNAIDVSFSEKYTASLFFPEGWGFFTKSPRDTKYVLYTASPGGLPLESVTYKNSSRQNLFGFSRASRRLNLEFSKFLPAIQSKCWHSLPDGTTTGAPAAVTTVAFSTKQFKMLKPGMYIVKKFDISPWAWAKFPTRFAKHDSYATVCLKSK